MRKIAVGSIFLLMGMNFSTLLTHIFFETDYSNFIKIDKIGFIEPWRCAWAWPRKNANNISIIMNIYNSKFKWYFFVIAIVFAIGLFENIFTSDERTDREYKMVKELIKKDINLHDEYGVPKDFSGYPSFSQYNDSSIYYTVVEYKNINVNVKCKIYINECGDVKTYSIKEFRGNTQSIKSIIQ